MKRTEITGSDVNAGGFDGTEGKKRLAEQLSNKRSALSYKQKLNEIIPCPRNITEPFTTGWITSLLGHSLFYVLGHSWINLHYTLQAGCLPHLPLPPLHSRAFAKAPRSGWGEGRAVRKWFLVVYSAGGGRRMLYFFPFKRNCLIYVCLLKGKCLATKQKQILTEAFLRALRE